jgi:hypothetical protein
MKDDNMDNTLSTEEIDESVVDSKPIVTDNDEIEELNKAVLGKLESPLIVHRKSDASYEENASSLEMNETHTDEERPTLTRHRFRKDPKQKHKGLKIFIAVIVILAAVFAALYYTGNITFNSKETTVKVTESTSETTTSLQQAYEGKIVIKNTYIFVDGVEVDGLDGLQKTLRYEDPSPTAYEIIIEGSEDEINDSFYNYDIYPLLQKMGFIDKTTVVTHIVSTGLVADEETTTETTTKKETTKKSTTKKDKTTTKNSDE